MQRPCQHLRIPPFLHVTISQYFWVPPSPSSPGDVFFERPLTEGIEYIPSKERKQLLEGLSLKNFTLQQLVKEP